MAAFLRSGEIHFRYGAHGVGVVQGYPVHERAREPNNAPIKLIFRIWTVAEAIAAFVGLWGALS